MTRLLARLVAHLDLQDNLMSAKTTWLGLSRRLPDALILRHIYINFMAYHGDIEQGRYHDPARLDGFPALAYFIGEDTDAEIYRRFNRLGARNLLYLQSIVNDLERKLEELDKHDAEHAAGNPKIRLCARRYGDLRACAEATDENSIEYGMPSQNAMQRVGLHRQIAAAIKQYRECNERTLTERQAYSKQEKL
jgi:hypothetical protein